MGVVQTYAWEYACMPMPSTHELAGVHPPQGVRPVRAEMMYIFRCLIRYNFKQFGEGVDNALSTPSTVQMLAGMLQKAFLLFVYSVVRYFV